MEMETLIQFVRENKERILADKLAGNANAANIVTLVNMLANYPDHAALGLLEAAIKEYQLELAEKKEGQS